MELLRSIQSKKASNYFFLDAPTIQINELIIGMSLHIESGSPARVWTRQTRCQDIHGSVRVTFVVFTSDLAMNILRVRFRSGYGMLE